MHSVAASWAGLGCVSHQHAPAMGPVRVNPECDIVQLLTGA
jgi:hypothetical protein